MDLVLARTGERTPRAGELRADGELRSARLNAAWRAELIDQADRGRRAAFESWRAHLAAPIDLDVVSVGGYPTVQYGTILRILPLFAVRSPRGLQLVAESLWDGEHPRPVRDECACAWLQARAPGIAALVSEIAERVAALE